jgi:hypothetical protein
MAPLRYSLLTRALRTEREGECQQQSRVLVAEAKTNTSNKIVATMFFIIAGGGCTQEHTSQPMRSRISVTELVLVMFHKLISSQL